MYSLSTRQNAIFESRLVATQANPSPHSSSSLGPRHWSPADRVAVQRPPCSSSMLRTATMSQVGWIQVIICGYCDEKLVEISNDRFIQIVEIAASFACASASLSRPFYS